MKGREGVDLFSLPSDILYNRERIRAVSRHSASSFYHLVATDYKLLIMDERYQKYPVTILNLFLSYSIKQNLGFCFYLFISVISRLC
jgi:hypothetical protein